MAETGSQRGKRMWPAPQTADSLFSLSNMLLIIGLSLTVVATIGAVWMANVRDGYLKRELSEAYAKIAELDVVTAEANAAAEKARESAAMAQERAAQLENDAARARERAARLERETAQLRLAYKELWRKSLRHPY